VASGRQHLDATHRLAWAALLLTPPVEAWLSGAPVTEYGVLLGAMGFFACKFSGKNGPDLDLIGVTISEREAERVWGRVLGTLWFMIWLPYARLIPHRHWLSHAPVIGTLGRLVWLLWLPVFVAAAYGHGQAIVDWAQTGTAATFVFWLIVSDGLHWVMDVIKWG